ncbi:hypothetical protein GLYMA_10G237600v4 [Glycine max]|uniref:Uncharacterized protein n=1 Tax=Glycine max TaxID=3847 RepID=A0A0R0HY27_SOYBN|nr:uncharacterized protein LOC100792832 isoform X3 [Glycine max]KAH1139798.1 hypothetical protein GYH30_028929 [Glycine max]KAH1230730.1 hypothetical protein GmHk_10G030106 [Glycine max]KRH35350.1 hypothetical protein GLYMA_10G237600v4 [Glycine max]|eukprot:XP_003536475.1 uncharacterized protein LOC100792832 isoform X3 [Glycine max]
MESTPDTQTASLWTDEKHLHYLNTMEASFVRTMLHHYAVVSPLRLDRYLPDTSESTLDSKPKKQATADSMGGSRGRRTKRRSSSKNKVQNSSPAEEQDGSKLEKGIESAACGQGGDDKEPIEN